MLLVGGIKKAQPTFLDALRVEAQPATQTDKPKPVGDVLDEFASLRPKRLPPKRDVNHRIEFSPSAATPYHMALPELRRLLKELRDVL